MGRVMSSGNVARHAPMQTRLHATRESITPRHTQGQLSNLGLAAAGRQATSVMRVAASGKAVVLTMECPTSKPKGHELAAGIETCHCDKLHDVQMKTKPASNMVGPSPRLRHVAQITLPIAGTGSTRTSNRASRS